MSHLLPFTYYFALFQIGLFNQITLENCPGLASLLRSDERLEDLMRMSPENILLRWVNYHLERAGTSRRMTNFNTDVRDSEIYSYLIKQIAPPMAGVTTEALHVTHYFSYVCVKRTSSYFTNILFTGF